MFSKDVKALIKTALDDAGIHLKVLNAVEAANDAQKHVLGEKVKARFGADLTGKHFALWGLAFKTIPTICVRRPARSDQGLAGGRSNGDRL